MLGRRPRARLIYVKLAGMPPHYLQPLLAPRSVALVGATEREGALGAIVWRNLAAAGVRGELYPVNPKHRAIFGKRAYARLQDAAAAAGPRGHRHAGTRGRARDRGRRGGRRQGGGDPDQRLRRDRRRGPGAAGAGGRGGEARQACASSARTASASCAPIAGLNATFARTPARPGNLALVSQSGAICGAILDWAASAEVGFTSVVSLGGAIDVDFGEVLDFLVADEATDAILMYVEGIRDARRYLSALRAAARVKPVVALKVGRYASGSRAAASHTGALVGSDEVFDAALRRAGSVRVKTYTQLFAAARVLATGRLPEGERLAIVTNGGGPGVVAADSAAENGVPLAQLSEETISRLDQELPPQWSRGNPLDLIGDAPPERFAAATAAALADPGVDALLAMYSPVAVTEPEAAAQAVADAARGSRKPVLAAWLGDINPNASRAHARVARHPELLHAGERGGGVLIPVRAPPQPGAAHAGAARGGRRGRRHRAGSRGGGGAARARDGGKAHRCSPSTSPRRCWRRSACRFLASLVVKTREASRGGGARDRLPGGAQAPFARHHAQVGRRRRAPRTCRTPRWSPRRTTT